METNTLEMVSAKDQLCSMLSIPMSPWHDTFGWNILVWKRTTGGHRGYLQGGRTALFFYTKKMDIKGTFLPLTKINCS